MVKEFVTERLKLIDLYPDKAKSVAEEYGFKEDEVELIRKGRVSSQPVIDRDARTVINYISTDAIDRDNEVIEHKGVVLDDYIKNPIVPWAHDYRGLPIGKNLWIKPDRKGLVAKTYFAKHPFAEQVFDLYTEDIKGTGPVLKAWSVGFIPLKWKDAKNGPQESGEIPGEGERSQKVRRTYKKWLLLEYSAVPVPCNAEALTLMVEKGLIKDKKLIKNIEEFIEIEDKQKTERGLQSLKELDREYDDFTYHNVEIEKAKDVILKPEENDDQIRLPVKGEEGKHKNHKIRWITVSAEKGIKGLYCIDDKMIITYIFDKKKGWTLKKAKAWMKSHGKQVENTIEMCTKEGTDFEEMQGLLKLDDENREFVEKLNDKDTKIKRPDLQGNPSVWDIIDAIEGKINIGIMPHRNWVCDLYPTKFPSGSCVVCIREKETKYYLYPYTYADGEIELGEPTELEQTYKPKKEQSKEGYEKYDKIADENWAKFAEEVQPQLIEKIEALSEEIKEIKEGRVLSGKNLKLVKDCREQITVTGELLDKLIVASEPPKEESILPLIEDNKGKENITDVNSLTKDDMPIIIEEVLKGLKEGMSGQHKEIQKIFDKSRGKVN